MSLLAYTKDIFRRIGDDELGASLVEYSLLVALIAVTASGQPPQVSLGADGPRSAS